MKILTSVLVLSLLLSVPGECNGRGLTRPQTPPGPGNTPTGTYRAQLTLEGLMQYYWKHDPITKNVSFFFACGQIGGQGSPANWAQCSCNNPTSCLNCYRWWDAVAMESLATYGIHTNSTNNSDIPALVFEHSPYNGGWNGKSHTFVDDFAWYGIAYLKVYQWLNDTVWLNHSLAIYDWVWAYGWDEPCGGFWWSTWPGQQFKDSITNMEMLHFSAKLAYLFPNNKQYMDNALKIWKWLYSFGSRGLLTEKNLISTGAMPELCCNTTARNPRKRCYNSKLEGTSYNQGLFLSAAAYLYALTEDKQYLDAGLMVLEGVIANYTTAGVLRDEMRSGRTYNGQCQGGADPGGDWYSFNGIFMLHLAYFTEITAEKNALPNATLQQIKTFVQRTSDSAWNNSAVWPPFNKINDACDSDAKKPNPDSEFHTDDVAPSSPKLLSDPTTASPAPAPSSPKFHWWWAKDASEQIMPPDAGLYLHKTDLRCMGDKTQLWDGPIINEDACMSKCTRNAKCSKYVFAYNFGGPHCWLWSYNRSDHLCNRSDHNFNVGVKRPVGPASCKGRCGSTKPLGLTQGLCYCDDACTRHLDCCLNYAEECIKEQYLSCKGLCDQVQAQAIPGGGYCWCFHGCNPNFTDNNSMGSCCQDYPQQCLGVKMPVCLDARSQGSALNLFLAHMKISSL